MIMIRVLFRYDSQALKLLYLVSAIVNKIREITGTIGGDVAAATTCTLHLAANLNLHALHFFFCQPRDPRFEMKHEVDVLVHSFQDSTQR